MRTFIKIGAVVAIAAVLFISLLTMFAKVFITPERVRATVLPVVEKALNREVQLEDISIHIFSGIILHDLRIMERDSDEIFISTTRASLRYRLLPLFSLEVVIDELRLEEPRIRIERRPDKTFNFSDLLASDKGAAPERDTTSRTAPAAEPGTTLPINLTIATVRLNQGTLLFIDTGLNPAVPAQYQISKLNALARSIKLDDSFPFEFSCRLNEASLSIDGRADILNQSGSASIKIDNLDATKFLPYFTDQIPGKLSSLNVDLSTQIHANPKLVDAKGTLALNDIHLTLDDLPDAAIRDVNLSLDFDLNADLTESLLQVTSLRLDYKGFIAEAAGTIEQLNTTPLVALDLQTSELNLDKLFNTAPLETGSNPGQKSSQEDSEATKPARELGPFDVPVAANGTIKIARLIYKGLPVSNLNLVYRLADNILTIDEMTGHTAEGSFNHSGRVDLGRKGLAYQGNLFVKNLQTDPIVSTFIPQAAQTIFGSLNLELNASGQGTLPETIKQNLTCLTKITFDEGRISGSKLAESLAEFLDIDELRDLHIKNFSGTVDIKQGRAQLDTILDGTDIRMSQKGTMGLDGALDLALNTSLGPKLLKKLDKRNKVTKYLTGKDGWGKLPLLLQGTLDKPRFSLHSEELIRQTEQTVIETLQEKLLEKIEEKQHDDSDNMTEEEKQARKERKKAKKKARKERKAAKKRARENAISEGLGN